MLFVFFVSVRQVTESCKNPQRRKFGRLRQIGELPMFGIIVAIIAAIAIGVYFKYVFGTNSSHGASCNGCHSCPYNNKHNNCLQNKLKNSPLKICGEDDESK
jgi:hypothetical protein